MACHAANCLTEKSVSEAAGRNTTDPVERPIRDSVTRLLWFHLSVGLDLPSAPPDEVMPVRQSRLRQRGKRAVCIGWPQAQQVDTAHKKNRLERLLESVGSTLTAPPPTAACQSLFVSRCLSVAKCSVEAVSGRGKVCVLAELSSFGGSGFSIHSDIFPFD